MNRYMPFVVAMAFVVVASNILVQFPVDGQVGRIALAEDGRLPLIETETVPLDEINDAYRRVKAGTVAGRVVVRP